MVSTLAYYVPHEAMFAQRVNTSLDDIHYAMIEHLRSMRDVTVLPVPLRSGIGSLNTAHRLLSTQADVLLFPYPSSCVPCGGRLHYMRVCVHKLIRLANRARRQRIVLVLLDLVVDQREWLGVYNEHQAARARRREKEFFGSADYLVVLSELCKERLVVGYGISPEKVLVMRRHPYITSSPNKRPVSRSTRSPDRVEWKLLYAGELSRSGERRNLARIIDVVEKTNNAVVYAAGPGGEWLCQYDQERVHYLGVLAKPELEQLADRCDIGLILYEPGTYADLCPATKYSLYVSHGLAIAATNSTTVSANIESDGSGFSATPDELPEMLAEVLAHPDCMMAWQANALKVGKLICDGFFVREWLYQILACVSG